MLKREGGLVDGKRIKAREQSAIFLYINRFAASTRQAADMFGHSATSIGTAFKSILKALFNVQGIGGVNDEDADEVISATQTAEAKEATKVRNWIAKRMWKKYNS
ncbi:unnamed protein product [Tilletia caries]|nr:unnamed protein product [Tilletia caries]